MTVRGISSEDAKGIVDEMGKKGVWIAVLRLPTGFGKSTSAPVIFRELYERGLAYNMIHVLPLRAIVEQQCRKLVCAESEDPRILYESLKEAGIGRDDIAFQSGDAMLRLKSIECGGAFYGAKKDPIFDSKAVVTTLDSFMMNLMKIPVAEVFKSRRHYASPLARIFTSAVFLDEAHYMSEDPRSIASTALLARYAQNARVPLILMSATIHKSHIEWIKLRKEEVVTACLEGDSVGEGCDVEIDGKEFIQNASAIEWKTYKVKGEDVVSKVKDLVGSGRRVLIGVIRVARAVEIYKELKKSDVEARLLHAGLTLGDRERILSEVEYLLKSGRGFALVATPVINAGVDLSFDALIAEASDFISIVQWSGRVCRDMGNPCKEPPEVIIVERGSKDYILKKIDELSKTNSKINWRIPFDDGGAMGYGRLIDIDAENTKMERVGREAMKLFKLFYPFFVYQKEITDYLLEEGSPVRRSLLIQAFIGSQDVDAEEALKNMITLEAKDVSGCAEYVDNYIEVIKEDQKVEVRQDEEVWEKIKNKLKKPHELYKDLAIAHMKKGSKHGVVAGGILIKKEVYSGDEGLLCI
jgi:CRISPR-associated helicase Cas3